MGTSLGSCRSGASVRRRRLPGEDSAPDTPRPNGPYLEASLEPPEPRSSGADAPLLAFRGKPTLNARPGLQLFHNMDGLVRPLPTLRQPPDALRTQPFRYIRCCDLDNNPAASSTDSESGYTAGIAYASHSCDRLSQGQVGKPGHSGERYDQEAP